MPRALFVCHSAYEGPGFLGEHLADLGFVVDTFVVVADPAHPVSHEPFPATEGYDVVAAMGAPWSVYDRPAIGSWIDRELAWLRAAHARGTPVLGVCFGAQALAAALGGTVSRAPVPEIGWHHVESSVGWIDSGPWFQWHGDRFTVPAGGREIARSPAAPQAFTIGRSLGVQFHPEVTVAIVADWLEGRSAREADFAAAGADPAAIIAGARAATAASLAAARRLVSGFLELAGEGRHGAPRPQEA